MTGQKFDQGCYLKGQGQNDGLNISVFFKLLVLIRSSPTHNKCGGSCYV